MATWKWSNPTTRHHLPLGGERLPPGHFLLLPGEPFQLFIFIICMPLARLAPPSLLLERCYWIGYVLLRDAMDTASSLRCFRLGERWTIDWWVLHWATAAFNHVGTMPLICPYCSTFTTEWRHWNAKNRPGCPLLSDITTTSTNYRPYKYRVCHLFVIYFNVLVGPIKSVDEPVTRHAITTIISGIRRILWNSNGYQMLRSRHFLRHY